MLLIVDLVFNCSVEYDDYGDNVILAFGGQLFVEISVFVIFFLMLCETYPFRIGLLKARERKKDKKDKKKRKR